jgi:hypothetical protein
VKNNIVVCSTNTLKSETGYLNYNLVTEYRKSQKSNNKSQTIFKYQAQMFQTSSELLHGASFDLNSCRMKLVRDSRIDLNSINIRFVSDLSFET